MPDWNKLIEAAEAVADDLNDLAQDARWKADSARALVDMLEAARDDAEEAK
jgi:ABC-type transporter Mla subunit MlaD